MTKIKCKFLSLERDCSSASLRVLSDVELVVRQFSEVKLLLQDETRMQLKAELTEVKEAVEREAPKRSPSPSLF